MKLFSLKNLALGAIFVVGSTVVVSAQNYNDEYREWQEAQRRAQEEYRDYQRTRSRSDYRDWQQAQRRAQQEYTEYRRTAGSNNRYTNRAGGSRNYRIYRNGSYYQTDYRGTELLRQAVNSGYQQGYRQGQNDSRYGRHSNYYGNNVYRSGTFGYQSHVARDQYQYYFQQGFQRGYEDGYNKQYRYGYQSNSGLNILGNILNGILNVVEN
ncbi:MAG TPA: hypothetical protein VJV05_05870 [Pyrinomonadaceae bacterium]|nr:hypothetical protein [Pyrinomonadaceae bacterium]